MQAVSRLSTDTKTLLSGDFFQILAMTKTQLS